MTDQLTLTQPLTGCEVTAQGTPDMTVHVTSGSVLVANASVTCAADDVTITAAHATQDRRDVIVADSSSVVSVLEGPLYEGIGVFLPDTTGYAVLAYVDVVNQSRDDYTGTITQDVITDKREFALVHVSPYRVSGLWYGPWAAATTNAWADQDMYLIPLFVGRTLDVQAIGTWVANPAATAGSQARFGIYADDGNGKRTLLVDAGQVAIDAGTAEASAVIDETLTPGWWWLAIAFQSLGGTKPTVAYIVTGALAGANSPIGAASLTTAASGRYGAIKHSSISAGLPTTPTSPSYSPTLTPSVWVQAT